MARPLSQSLSGLSVQGGGGLAVRRNLPEEMPVAVVFDGTTQAVMMASPGDIADFAHGFALSEGFIEGLDQVESFEVVEHEAGIEARFWLTGDRAGALDTRRRRMMGPVGCGLCGIDSLEEASRPLPKVTGDGLFVPGEEVARATDELRVQQPLHDQTHAVHAAGFLVPGRGIVAGARGCRPAQRARQADRRHGAARHRRRDRSLRPDQPRFGRTGSESRGYRLPDADRRFRPHGACAAAGRCGRHHRRRLRAW